MKYRNDSATALLNPIDRIECRIHYVELPPGNNARKITRHAHECCEIYVNVSGDVSFAVEDAIYPIGRGDVIIIPSSGVSLLHPQHKCRAQALPRHILDAE